MAPKDSPERLGDDAIFRCKMIANSVVVKCQTAEVKGPNSIFSDKIFDVCAGATKNVVNICKHLKARDRFARTDMEDGG